MGPSHMKLMRFSSSSCDIQSGPESNFDTAEASMFVYMHKQVHHEESPRDHRRRRSKHHEQVSSKEKSKPLHEVKSHAIN